MPTVSTGASVPYNISFSFEDPILQPYQRRSEKRLALILEQLDLGSETNLGYTKVQWLPDDVVRIRYLAMEGVLEPIIVIRVEFQEVFKANFDQERLDELLEELEEEVEPPEEPDDYIPYLWVGIACFDHKLAGGPGTEDNSNCAYWGYPIDPHLIGFEPRQVGAGQVDYDFEQSCETLPGSVYHAGSWASRVGNNADQQLLYRVNDGQEWTPNAFATSQGTFQDSDWVLSAQGLVQATHTNMVAMEHVDTQVTLPVGAEDGVPAGYWKRSIIIDPGGIHFPTGARGYTCQMGGGAAAAMSANYNGGSIVGHVLSGHYEISCFTQSFPCECTTAHVHIRVIVGALRLNADGQAIGGNSTVTDFYPQGIGNPPEANAMLYKRQLMLGGNPPCGFGTDENDVFGPNNHRNGYWAKSIFVNVQNGTMDTGLARRISPFFEEGCPNPTTSPGDPECISGCIGNPTVQPAHNLDYPRGIHWLTFDNAGGGEETLDLRAGVLWHMARVVSIDAVTKHICFIQLVGNDGAQGGSCGGSGCEAFSYGHMIRAIGIDPSIVLGTNLSEHCASSPDGQCSYPYGVGQLVVVVGWTDHVSEPCGVHGGDWRLIVTTPHGAGEDFTSLFWSQLRCPGFIPVDRFFNGVEYAFRHRSSCEGGPLAVRCACINGKMRCIES